MIYFDAGATTLQKPPEVAAAMVKKFGPTWLMNHCKVHFQTTDKVLAACGLDRSCLPPEGRISRAEA